MLNARVTPASDGNQRLHQLLQTCRTERPDGPAALLQQLVREGMADLPLPGSGHTLQRWQVLSEVAAHDLSLAKLFEGHTDALAILRELGCTTPTPPGSTWGVWAAESPDARVVMHPHPGGAVLLDGRKNWCSGARTLSHALLTAWQVDGTGPYMVKVALQQAGVRTSGAHWHAVGMAGSASVDVEFQNVAAEVVGGPRAYLERPGFWHGGAGIAACWYGGARTLAQTLLRSVAVGSATARNPFRLAALGRIDLALQQTAAVLREAAAWIDAFPLADASAVALRARLGAEACAACVLEEAGRVLGAAPFCRDAHFARMAADLPVFVRQSGADRDLVALGEHIAATGNSPWSLQW